MTKKVSFALLAIACLVAGLSIFLWSKPQESSLNQARDEHKVPIVNTSKNREKPKAPAQEGKPDPESYPEVDPVSLRQQALSSWQPWSNDILQRLHNMHPADLLDFLDDNELLQHNDARSLVNDIYGTCGVYLGLLAAKESGERVSQTHPNHAMLEDPGGEWCARMSEGDTAQRTRERLAELLEVSTTVDPAGAPRRQAAFERLEKARGAGGQKLMQLLNSEDSLTATLAVEALWNTRNREFLEDWSLVESLSADQRQRVMTGLHTTLECQQMGDCSVDTLSVGSLCLSSSFQCDGQISLDGVLYQSLSRRQLDAYYQLINRVRQHRSDNP